MIFIFLAFLAIIAATEIHILHVRHRNSLPAKSNPDILSDKLLQANSLLELENTKLKFQVLEALDGQLSNEVLNTYFPERPEFVCGQFGLWFQGHDNFWRKNPKGVSAIYYNGLWVGYYRDPPEESWIELDRLNKSQAKLSPRASGNSDKFRDGRFWNFPLGYVPKDSDFEVLDENT